MEVNKKTAAIEKVWETSVSETLDIFRDALLTLIPIMERAHIPYKDDEQYDDYDSIAKVLYQEIVINSIRWSFPDLEGIRMADYGYTFDPEQDTAFIEVSKNAWANKGIIHVFRSFYSQNELLDSVLYTEFNIVNKNDLGTTRFCTVANSEFRLRYKEKENNGFAHKSTLSVFL